VLQVIFCIWAAPQAYLGVDAIVGRNFGEVPMSPKTYYNGWVTSIMIVYALDYSVIALEAYCFHLGIRARVAAREDPALFQAFQGSSVRSRDAQRTTLRNSTPSDKTESDATSLTTLTVYQLPPSRTSRSASAQPSSPIGPSPISSRAHRSAVERRSTLGEKPSLFQQSI
jgi:hypothetical protein